MIQLSNVQTISCRAVCKAGRKHSSWFGIWDSGWSCVVLKITIPLISVLNSVSWGDVVLKKELTLLKMIISASLTF